MSVNNQKDISAASKPTVYDEIYKNGLKESEEMQSMDGGFNQVDLNRNPMIICVVINRIFQNLSLADIKTFRFVCQEWNYVAEPLLRKRSKIVFKSGGRGPLNFLKDFEASHSNLVFTHFLLTEDLLPYDAYCFFVQYSSNIVSLKFQCVDTIDGEYGERVASPRIRSSTWGSNCRNLKELHIDLEKGSRQFIELELLSTVKYLHLKNCAVFLQNGVKISPISLFLFNVLFIADIKTKPEQLLLNDVFNFYKTKDIYINQYRANHTILDMGKDVAKVERLILIRVEILNLGTSRWNVDYALLEKISLTGKITAGLKQLIIDNLGCKEGAPFPYLITRNTIDLSVLPSTLERLSFQNEMKTDYICSDLINLPNLKTLQIVVALSGKPIELSHFTGFPI